MKYSSLLWQIPLGVLLSVTAWQAYNLRGLPAWTERQIAREAQQTRLAALSAIADTRKDLTAQVSDLRQDLMQRTDNLLTVSEQQIGNITAMADARLADVAAKADAQITGLRADLTPTLQHVESITANADAASAILFRRDALPAQLLGLTAAAKVTLGETAQTMRTIRLNAPLITANVKRATDEGAATAQQTRLFMTNLTQATKPLPAWARIGLGVAPPLVQTGFTFASWLTLKGRSR